LPCVTQCAIYRDCDGGATVDLFVAALVEAAPVAAPIPFEPLGVGTPTGGLDDGLGDVLGAPTIGIAAPGVGIVTGVDDGIGRRGPPKNRSRSACSRSAARLSRSSSSILAHRESSMVPPFTTVYYQPTPSHK
jgi:hypothetical protein